MSGWRRRRCTKACASSWRHSRHDDEPASETAEPIVLINPEIVVKATETADDWEGCLSIPDLRGRVPRAVEVKVRAFDRHGTRIEIDARGFSARVIQHEYRSPRRRALPRPDALVRVALVSRRVLALLGQGRRLPAGGAEKAAVFTGLGQPAFLRCPLGLKPLQLHLGVIREAHRLGEGAMTCLIRDQTVHLLAHAAVGGMPLWCGSELDEVHRFAGVHVEIEPHAIRHRHAVARHLVETGGRQSVVQIG